MKNKIVNDTIRLFIITLVAGIILGIVYNLTKAPIATQEELSKQNAYKMVLSAADKFEGLADEKYSDANITATLSDALKFSEDALEKDDIAGVVVGTSNGAYAGLVVTVIAHDGYGGDIKYAVGIDKDGILQGISFLAISETAGLGMRAKQDPSFAAQFTGVSVDRYVLVKDGSGSNSDSAIDAISGSTVTSKAVLRGVNAAKVAVKEIKAAKAVTKGGVTVE